MMTLFDRKLTASDGALTVLMGICIGLCTACSPQTALATAGTVEAIKAFDIDTLVNETVSDLDRIIADNPQAANVEDLRAMRSQVASNGLGQRGGVSGRVPEFRPPLEGDGRDRRQAVNRLPTKSDRLILEQKGTVATPRGMRPGMPSYHRTEETQTPTGMIMDMTPMRVTP